MSRVILVGEPMALFIAEEQGTLDKVTTFKRSAAGAEMNVAIGLKRLEHEVCYITKLGRDPFGKYLIDFLTSYCLLTWWKGPGGPGGSLL